jgi:hypothetical protein
MGGAGVILVGVAILFVILRLAPQLFAGQTWLLLIPYATKAALGVLTLGAVLFAIETTASKIADISQQDEAAGKSPVRGWLMSSAFGLGVLYLAYKFTLGASLLGGTGQVSGFQPNVGWADNIWGNVVLALPVVALLGCIALGGVRVANGRSAAQSAGSSWGKALVLNGVLVAAIFGAYAMFLISQP